MKKNKMKREDAITVFFYAFLSLSGISGLGVGILCTESSSKTMSDVILAWFLVILGIVCATFIVVESIRFFRN